MIRQNTFQARRCIAERPTKTLAVLLFSFRSKRCWLKKRSVSLKICKIIDKRKDGEMECYARNLELVMVWCENHVRRLRTFFTVVLEPNIHTFSVLSETLPDFLKSKLC